ncbi:hypothetical protein DL98DRAFT_590254 [Cadophora sp. DSE1049]|nr:hypothetical protein DL98DRAFT_590254 [Cadophora sp. DSE1049]
MCTSPLHIYACHHTEHEIHRYCDSNPPRLEECPKYSTSSNLTSTSTSISVEKEIKRMMEKDGCKLLAESKWECSECFKRKGDELREQGGKVLDGGWVEEWSRGVKTQDVEEDTGDDVGVSVGGSDRGDGSGSGLRDDGKPWVGQWGGVLGLILSWVREGGVGVGVGGLRRISEATAGSSSW